ncbi:hypothetical protein G3480_10955 [Thiorhodococcus mannitoliphagus]|uniref:VWA-like domain-containing protein n=1 Tax=Thiorhodococcus mannitoliphagus TaxID=329406 RepID=A0A6P1DYP6_9GAMM|nr:VWA-like domain-containing protein [Thiorhodococcus mannitoliphagus]NEX20824.1 hypothetical protein [Thiorhodococcus mannitoliphagus]
MSSQSSGGQTRAVYSHRGTRAIQKMVELAPATGGLALWMRHLDVDALDGRMLDDQVLAANDGTTIYYGPEFEQLALSLQIGLVSHQVLHVALRHAQRMVELQRLIGDVDAELFNICADAIVNSALGHLSWLELPPRSVRLEDLLASALEIRQGAEAALLEWDLERLYRAVDDRRSGGSSTGSRRGAGQTQDSAAGAGSGGQHRSEAGRAAPREDGPCAARARYSGSGILRDLLPAANAEHPELEAEQSREWRERITRAHAGDGAHSMLRTLLADLPRVRTPWEQLLRTQLRRGLAHKPDISWSRPARSYLANQGRIGRGPKSLRMPWEPGSASTRSVARLAVMVDVSGSIEDALLQGFAREIEAITRRLESRIVVIIGDDQVTDVRSFEPGRSNLRDIRFQGGGGTDFSPLLREAERFAPDMGVFLTDLDGKADYLPSFPVLWAVPAAYEAMPVPFGRKLVLD